MADLKKKDLYLLLGVKEDATTPEIRKAYRKQALKYHPDKNPDDKKAADLFHELSEALKILTDVGARAAYDHVRLARKAAADRTARWDEGRKRAKLDLDQREKAAATTDYKAEDKLLTEIERLREEGSRIFQEECANLKQQLREKARATAATAEPGTLKVKWKPTSETETLYTSESLRNIFSKYGKVSEVVIAAKKKFCTAVVEFSDARQAKLACDVEIGFPQCPMNISWLSGQTQDVHHPVQEKNIPSKQSLKAETTKSETAALNVDELEALVFAKIRKKKEENTGKS